MPDERGEVNLLNREVNAPEAETAFEAPETQTETGATPNETPQVDQTQLANIKAAVTAQVEAAQATPKDPVLVGIEEILSANLAEIYTQLPEDKREAFKVKGEEVAANIQTMIVTAKLKVHKILKMLSDWLGMIPSVNVFFLRQEAKLKLDKVLDFAEDQANHPSL